MSLHLGRRLGALALALAASAALAGPAQAALTATDGTEPFPVWWEDDSGLRLEECDDAALCPAGAGGEHLYYEASAEIPVDGGTISWAAAVEGANGAPATTSAGMRIDGDGLIEGRQYTITDPYSRTPRTATAGAGGTFRILAEAGCDVEPPATCDPAEALATEIGPFLRPAGIAGSAGNLLGDGETPGPVVGSPTGNNFIRVQAPGVDVTETNLTVIAQVNREATRGLGQVTPGLSFPARQTGTGPSGSQPVSVANVGFAGLALTGAALSGPNAGDFSISNSCPLSPAFLGAGSACSLGIAFTPSAAGARSATLTIPTDGANGDGSLATGRTHTVALSGTGTNPPPSAAAAGATPGSTALAGAPSQSTALRPRLLSASLISSLRLRNVKARGLALRLGTANASRLLVRILRNGRVVYRTTIASSRLVRLNSRALRRRLRTGRYQMQLTPISASGARGTTISRSFRIRR